MTPDALHRPFADPGSFVWVAGIEDTCVYPPADSGMLPLDEYDLTEHTAHWRDDLRSARELGATAVRYGVNWPLVHVAPGRFDWSMLDERLAYAHDELGLTVIADLVHYGTPTWLDGSFADPRYAQVVAEFAGAFAGRFRGIVDHITPLNEPLTTASFCGLRGVWPPSLTGWDGWTTVMLGIAEGIVSSIRAIRAANPDAVIVHVEAASIYSADDPELSAHAVELERRGMLATDLVLGRVDATHPLEGWLREQGASPRRLADLLADPPSIDLLGVNYYPALTPRVLVAGASGTEQLAVHGGAAGLATALRAFGDRYDLPMLITETSIEGDDQTRAAWLADSVSVVSELRSDGLDVRGYTWWPLLDFVDWSYASGGRNVEEFHVDDAVIAARIATASDGGRRSKEPFLRRMGIIRLEEGPDGGLRRVMTPAAAAFGAAAAGPGMPDAAMLDSPGGARA